MSFIIRKTHLPVGLAFQLLVGLDIRVSLALQPSPQDPRNLGYPGKRRSTQLYYLQTELKVFDWQVELPDVMQTDLVSLGADDTDGPRSTLGTGDIQRGKWKSTGTASDIISVGPESLSSAEIYLQNVFINCKGHLLILPHLFDIFQLEIDRGWVCKSV